MGRTAQRLRAIALNAMALFFCLPQIAAAEDVTLRFPDGSFEVTGPLLSFDGLSYRVDTRFGVLTIAAATVECEGACPSSSDPVLVRLSGTPLLADVLVPALVDAFARSIGAVARPLPPLNERVVSLALVSPDDAPLAVFEVVGGSTSEGFAALSEGRADIVLADRDLTEAERALMLELGLGDLSAPERRRLVARRDLSLFAGSAAERVGSLPAPQLPAVLSGEITSWGELGGDDVPIRPGVLSDDVEALEARLAGLETPFTLSIAELASEGEAEAFLSGDPGALVIAESAAALGRPISLSNGCNRGIADDADGSGDPLRLELWAYTAAPRLSDIARAFLVFATGPDAQRVVDRAGFLDKRPRPVPLEAQGARLAQAVMAVESAGELDALQSALSRLSGLERLSVTFRFEEGDVPILTALGASEARNLASLIDSGAFDGRSLLFVGFVDSAGDGEIGRRLSEAQARVVLEEVQAATQTRFDRVEMLSQGMGALFPLACGDTGWSRHVNRRVEIWLGPGPVPID